MGRSGFRWLLSLLVFAGFMVHVCGFHRSVLLERLENFSYDARVRLTLKPVPDPRVVIVDIDERSIAAEGQFPWPRDKLAQLVERLFDRYRVLALGFDIAFPDPDSRSGVDLIARLASDELAELPGFAERAMPLLEKFDYDRRFAQAIAGRRVVLGVAFKGDDSSVVGQLCAPLLTAQQAAEFRIDWGSQEGITANVPVLQQATPYCGYFDNEAGIDEDGVFRRVPLVQAYGGAVYPSLSLALLRAALGDPPLSFGFEPAEARDSAHLERLRLGDLSVPVDGSASAYVPYRGPYRTFTYISATDVLHGRADATRLQGAIVLVGTSAPGLLDLRNTPVGKAYAGVEVHASMVSGMLGGRVRYKPSYYVAIEVVMLLTVALIMAALFSVLSPLRVAAASLALIAAIIALAQWLWNAQSLIAPLGLPVLFTLALLTAQLLYGYFVEARRARNASRKFGQYVPPEIVNEMVASGRKISMEGSSREITVLFSDVRGFTTISEKLDARELGELMNEFLTPLTGVIQQHRGTIDKYMGDAIMAFWGAPLDDAQHARHALQAGLEMARVLRQLDEPFKQRGWPPLYIGVGLNTGVMRVGNMGSEFRVAYTVMGDAVNLGSRLEGLTKEYGVTVICSESTRAQAPEDWLFRELDRVRVKGKKEPVTIYEPLGAGDTVDSAMRQELERHLHALALYRSQDWDAAQAAFAELAAQPQAHKVYKLFMERIVWLRDNSPGEGWDGAFTFEHK